MTHTKACVRFPSPAAGMVKKPTTLSMSLPLKGKSLSLMKEPEGNIYQRYIFLQERGDPSVYISTHVVHESMEVRIDQSYVSVEPFLNRTQAHLAPKPPVFESRRMRERSRKRASLTITHNNQTTYQTIYFKHNNNITWTRTVLGNNSNQM